MKLFFGLNLIFFFIVACNASNSSVPLLCNGKTGLICADDCKTFMTCVGDLKPVYSNTCKMHSVSTPYCVNNRCTSEPDYTNPQCINSFRCTSKGMFPDPDDCTVYHACPKLNGVAKTFKCLTDYTYNATMEVCVYNATCLKVNCTNNFGKFVDYPRNPGYYAFCGESTYMFKCKDEVNEIFNTTLDSCVYNCKSNGTFIDSYDCTRYKICDWYNGKYNIFTQQCPPGYYYDAPNSQCIEGTCVSKIQQ